MKGLLLDFGGVLTTNVFDSFREFCVAEGLPPDAVRDRFMKDPMARSGSPIVDSSQSKIAMMRPGESFATIVLPRR